MSETQAVLNTSINTRDGSGSFGAYVARPTSPNAPGLIIIQEIFGVNANIRAIADDYAAQGYLAVAPDIFWRQKPGISLTDKTDAEWQQAFAYLNGFDIDKGIEDLAATLDWLRTQTSHVGCIGFCLGGRLAVLMATRTDIDAAVSYYGVTLEKYVSEYTNIQKPLLVHVAELDKYAPPEARRVFEPALTAQPSVEYHLYEGVDHAFSRLGGAHYDAAAAKLAGQRTVAFLQSHLKDQR